MATLSYETVGRRQWVFVPPATWLKWVVVVGTGLILLMFLVALPPARGSAALDYTRNIPLGEAIAYSWNADWSTVMMDRATAPLVWFIPVAIACAVVFAASHRRWLTLTAVGAALLFPFFLSGTHALLLPLIAAIALPALLGQADGETWSEGFVAMGCLGAWMMLWAGAALLLVARRRPAAVVSDPQRTAEGDRREGGAPSASG